MIRVTKSGKQKIWLWCRGFSIRCSLRLVGDYSLLELKKEYGIRSIRRMPRLTILPGFLHFLRRSHITGKEKGHWVTTTPPWEECGRSWATISRFHLIVQRMQQFRGEERRIFWLLAGLNPEYEYIRVQILGRETFPPLNSVYALLKREESRHIVMQQTPTVVTERSALATDSRAQRGRGQKGTGDRTFVKAPLVICLSSLSLRTKKRVFNSFPHPNPTSIYEIMRRMNLLTLSISISFPNFFSYSHQSGGFHWDSTNKQKQGVNLAYCTSS